MVPKTLLRKDEADGSEGQSSIQDHQGNQEEDTTIIPSSSMMYCASEIAPPPPVILQQQQGRGLVNTTKVADPLTEEQLQSIPKEHEILCKCGCIPAIPSMFQMAELRKQAREKKKAKLLQRK